MEQSGNPFAVVVQAHLTALRTRDNAQDRLQAKWHLTRRLYERGFDRRVIIGLYRFLDWVLVLSEELGAQYQRQLSEYEEEKKMPYVTSIERMGIKKDREEGLQLGQQQGSAGRQRASFSGQILGPDLRQSGELPDVQVELPGMFARGLWVTQQESRRLRQNGATFS